MIRGIHVHTHSMRESLPMGADSEASLTEPCLENAQTLAMGGASQSNSFSNIAMLNNVAAMVFIPRYSIETAYLVIPNLMENLDNKFNRHHKPSICGWINVRPKQNERFQYNPSPNYRKFGIRTRTDNLSRI